MKKMWIFLPLVSILSACAPLDKKEQKIEVPIPMMDYGEPEKATSQTMPKGSKIFVIYAQENTKNNISVAVSSSIVVSDGAVYIGSSCSGCSTSHLTYRSFQGEVERQLINKGFKPTFANLINNDKLYMDSHIMLDRVASLGKSVNAPYTLLIRDAYIGYGEAIAWSKPRGCGKAIVSPLIANLDAILLNNNTGEIMTSFSYKMTNIENSYNSKPATLYHYSRHKYYDYVENRGFNMPGSDWPSCHFGVTHQPEQYDNLCWGTSNDCKVPENTFKTYRNKTISELISGL